MNFSEDTGEGGRLRKRDCIRGQGGSSRWLCMEDEEERGVVGWGWVSAGRNCIMWSWDFLSWWR